MTRTALLLAATMIAAPALAQTTAPATTPAPAATAPTATAAPAAAVSVTAGAKVVDTAGAAVGTIEAVNGTIATLSTGTSKVGVPTASFAQGKDALVIGVTRTELDAKAAQATASAAASTAPQFAVGATVSDQSGAKVGTVKAVNDTLVTVASETASAQLPKTAFAQSPTGLIIALSPAQFEAAAKAAGGAKPATAATAEKG